MSLLNRDELRSIGLSDTQMIKLFEAEKNNFECGNKFVNEVKTFCREKIKEHGRIAFELNEENEKEINEEEKIVRQYKALMELITVCVND